MATLTNINKATVFDSFLLLEDGFYLLREDLFRIALEQSGTTAAITLTNINKS